MYLLQKILHFIVVFKVDFARFFRNQIQTPVLVKRAVVSFRLRVKSTCMHCREIILDVDFEMLLACWFFTLFRSIGRSSEIKQFCSILIFREGKVILLHLVCRIHQKTSLLFAGIISLVVNEVLQVYSLVKDVEILEVRVPKSNPANLFTVSRFII